MDVRKATVNIWIHEIFKIQDMIKLKYFYNFFYNKSYMHVKFLI